MSLPWSQQEAFPYGPYFKLFLEFLPQFPSMMDYKQINLFSPPNLLWLRCLSQQWRMNLGLVAETGMRYGGWGVNRYSSSTREVFRSLSILVAGLGFQHIPEPLAGTHLACLASAETRTWTDVCDGNICTFLARYTPFWRSFSYLYDRFLSPVLPEYTDEEDESLHWYNVAYSFQTKIWFCIALCHIVHNVPLSFKTLKNIVLLAS